MNICIIIINTAFPDSMFVEAPDTIYAKVGESVQLDCPISPGALLQQYYVSWDESGTGIYHTRAYQPSPVVIDNRYDLNRSTLSLIINDVRLEDASDMYHCVIRVVAPETTMEYSYNNLRTVPISLVVYGKRMTKKKYR